MGWTAVSVLADASAARSELRTLRRDLDARWLLDGDGVAQLRTYSERFASIERRLDNRFLMPIRAMPVAGRQLLAAKEQAGAAAVGIGAVASIGADIDGLVGEGLRSGPGRVDTLNALAAIAGEGRQTFESLDLGPDRALVGPLSSAREEIEQARQEALDGLDRTERMSAGLATLFTGPSDYLLFAANNAQMQNGQGMFLSAGVLRVEDGRMKLGPMDPVASVPEVRPPIPLEPDLEARWGWLNPNRDLRHLGLSHRFPVTAMTGAQLWAALGNPEVDGVIVVDPHVLQTIMMAGGPVSTSDGGELRAEDVVAFILHGQYQGYLADGNDSSYTTERRDELSDIASTALDQFEGVTELDADFIDQFQKAAGGRHLLMWSRDPRIQAAFEAAGIDGQISPESLLLSLVNRSGNKLDWFMRMSADMTLDEVADGYEVTVDIAVTNEAPAAGEPQYVVGPYPGSGLERAQYLGLVTLNLPQTATSSRFDGVDPLAVAGADGPNRTIAAWVRVARGTTTHLVARFHLPASATTLIVEPSARTHATSWSFDGQEWTDTSQHDVGL